MKHSQVVTLLVPVLLAGCANLATVGRVTEIPPAPKGETTPAFAGGIAIHLDAAQRLFYQVGNHFCAEPMPDALQSLASSNGVGAGAADKASAAISTAFSTNAASIGLHTQSTTLMRDQYYRICELAANTNMTAAQVAQLMERSQRYTLGILAVEQLTGAVVAQQATLTGDAISTSAASLGVTQSALNSALADQTTRKAAAEAAAAAASAADTKAKTSTDAVTSAPAGTAAADLQKLKDQQAADKAADNKAHAEADAAAKDYQDAQATVATLRDSLGAAKANASAATNGGAALAPSATHSNIDKDTASVIATATKDIVASLMTRGDVVDSCMAMMMDKDATAFFSARPDLKSVCQSAIQTAVANAANGKPIPFHMKVTLDKDTLAKLGNSQPVDLEAEQIVK